MLELTPLRHFKALVETGSFSRAAKDLYVTQPAVSHQVRELEKALGVQLLIRGRGKIHLTPPGQFLYGFCKDLFARLEEAESRIQELKTEVQGAIRVGAPAGIYDGWFSRILAELVDLHPGISLKVVIGSHETLRQLLLERSLDAALLLEETALDQRQLDYQPVYDEEYVLLAASGFVFAGKSVEELEFVTFQENDHMLNLWLDKNHEGDRHQIRLKHVINHVPGIIDMVRRGLGVTVLPRHAVEHALTAGDLVELETPRKNVHNTFYLATRKQDYRPPALRELVARALAGGNLN